MMGGIKLAAVAAALLGGAVGLGPAGAASIGTGPGPGSSSTVAQVDYRYHYGCFPWNEAWGIPGCQGYERAVSGEPVLQCRYRRTRHGLRRICSPAP